MATLKQALNNVAKINNAEYWDMCRRFSPDFKKHTSAKTLSEFNEKGFEALKLTDLNTLNEFFNISMRVAFQMMNVSRAKNIFENSGLLEVYNTPNGGFTQRIAINSIKPVSPAFTELQDGTTVDPFIVRKPELVERFFGINYEYQSFITLQEYQLKTMYIEDYGMGATISGILEGLSNGYKIQEVVNIKECINAAINSTKFPLQGTQKFELQSWSDVPTNDELVSFIEDLQNISSSLEITPQTGMYNAMNFETSYDASDFVLLIRAGVINKIKTRTLPGIYHDEYLALPFAIQEVTDFGGLEHYADANFETKVYPVYSKVGEMIGWSEKENQTTAKYGINDVYTKDVNEDVIAVLMQKGAIFENNQNPYTVEPIRNPRGLYTNYWASRPNNSINYDPLYATIVFKKPTV